MKFNLSKVGAFALPALTLTALAGAGYGGAFTGKAQAATAASPMVMIDTLPVAPGLADNDTQPRFVAQTDPVSAATQPMPERLSELVAELHHSAPMSSEMRCLAGAIYFEARGEPLEGQLAVAQVIVNRAESPRFPDDY